MSVDFPAPEGPMMATSSPLLNFPEMPFKRVLYPVKKGSRSFPAIPGHSGSAPSATEANTEHGIADPRPQARVSPHSIYKNAEFWA